MVLALTAALCVASPSDSLLALYTRGKTYAEFLTGVRQRRDTWVRNTAWRRVDSTLLARARALQGHHRLLVVAEDWCNDSANTVPYLATLVDSLGGTLEIRIVNSVEGHWVMERHPTGDGRAATPTVVVLDRDGNDAGCWVERPAALVKWVEKARRTLSGAELVAQKKAWYDEDRGRETIRDVLDLLESPGTRCGGNGN